MEVFWLEFVELIGFGILWDFAEIMMEQLMQNEENIGGTGLNR